MDKDLLEKLLKMLASDNDADAVMGLRGAQKLFQSAGAELEDALRYAADHTAQWAKCKEVIHQQKAAAPTVNNSGVPECRVTRPGVLEVVPAGKTTGELYPLPGESARDAEKIAVCLKDAIVAAVINKSRFKLKLNDIKNNKGEIVETILQAEYERTGMVPVQIWLMNNRGEVGALAAVLRKLVANNMPDLMAA